MRDQLSEAQARVQLNNASPVSLQPVTFDAATFTEESPVGAISMLNMLNSVMAAFKQQVKDARILGEQEGRKALQHEFEDVINKARNDGYRDAMTYLDDRATTARESGAKEERARIANMGFFERRRYLNIHVALPARPSWASPGAFSLGSASKDRDGNIVFFVGDSGNLLFCEGNRDLPAIIVYLR